MRLAFGLAFDLRRISCACLGLCWTAALLFGALAVLARSLHHGDYTAGGLRGAWRILFEGPLTPSLGLLWGVMLLAWWLGFSYLTAPIHRSVALDIGRDESETSFRISALNRQATLAPLLGLLAPLAMLALVILWSLLALIPGAFGAVIAIVTLPMALIAALIGAALLLIIVFATPLVAPTAGIEGRDYFEAVSRPMSYVMQNVGRYVLYWIAKLGVVAASAIAGLAVLGVAWAMVGAALWLTGQGELAAAAVRESLASGAGDLSEAPTPFGIAVVVWISAFLLAGWLLVVWLSCDTIMYLLLRYRIDGVTFDRVMIPEEAIRALPSAVETAEQAEESRRRHDEQAGGDLANP